MDLNKIMSSPALQAMDKEKRALILQLAQRVQGKNMMEALSIFMEFQGPLTKGKPLTDAERSAIMEVLAQNMSDGERQQLRQVMAMAQAMRK